MAEKTNDNNNKVQVCAIIATVQVDGQIREDRENYLRVLSLAGTYFLVIGYDYIILQSFNPLIH